MIDLNENQLRSRLASVSQQISGAEWEVHKMKSKRDELLRLGVEMDVPRSQLADWAGIRRESVYYAVLRAANRRKDVNGR